MTKTLQERKAEAVKAREESQKLLQKSLSNEVLQNKFYEKWNGVLPTVVSGDSDLLLNIGK